MVMLSLSITHLAKGTFPSHTLTCTVLQYPHLATLLFVSFLPDLSHYWATHAPGQTHLPAFSLIPPLLGHTLIWFACSFKSRYGCSRLATLIWKVLLATLTWFLLLGHTSTCSFLLVVFSSGFLLLWLYKLSYL